MLEKKLKANEFTTRYQFHKNFVPALEGLRDKVIDFTEHRLLKILSHVRDVKVNAELQTVLEDYRNGKVIVAWRAGNPVYLAVKPSR